MSVVNVYVVICGGGDLSADDAVKVQQITEKLKASVEPLAKQVEDASRE